MLNVDRRKTDSFGNVSLLHYAYGNGRGGETKKSGEERSTEMPLTKAKTECSVFLLDASPQTTTTTTCNWTVFLSVSARKLCSVCMWRNVSKNVFFAGWTLGGSEKKILRFQKRSPNYTCINEYMFVTVTKFKVTFPVAAAFPHFSSSSSNNFRATVFQNCAPRSIIIIIYTLSVSIAKLQAPHKHFLHECIV